MLERLKEIQMSIIEKTSISCFLIWVSFCVVSILLYFCYPLFELNENQILYLFSAASQVIAAIYGLIITGYIFLRNELDRKADKDESFEEIVLLLKTEYFGSIVNISIVTFSSIILCFLTTVGETNDSKLIVGLIINVAVPTIVTNLILIISFVIKILNPNSLELASNKLRELTSRNEFDNKGSLEDFLKNYNQIEYILEKYGTAFSNNEFQDYETIRSKRIAKSKLVNILYTEEKIDITLKNNLIELISFRNSIIHGSDLFVSRADVELSERILNQLKK
ncbi:MAG: hypothetical protein IPN10_03710 [Saprospiraceae bacterium]|nr:hypothetical protein [Saprospiraceae bacterium]